MDTIPPSGFYYPNKIARIFLLAMEEIMGKNGLNAVLNMARQPNLIDNYPPDNLEKEFDFSQFSALNAARIAGKSDSDIRALVAKLQAARTETLLAQAAV